MPTATTSHMLTIAVTNLQAGNPLTISLTDPDATWSLTAGARSDGFAIRAAGGQPLSLGGVSLSTKALTLTAGTAPLTCTIVAQAATVGAYLSGTTQTNDSGVTVKASTQSGIAVDMEDDWTINFS